MISRSYPQNFLRITTKIYQDSQNDPIDIRTHHLPNTNQPYFLKETSILGPCVWPNRVVVFNFLAIDRENTRNRFLTRTRLQTVITICDSLVTYRQT